MTIDRPTSLHDVRPGDIFFTNIGGIVPGLFPVKIGQLMLGERARIGRRSFDHVGIVTDPRRLSPPHAVQAMPGGAEEIVLTEPKYWTDEVTFMRLPEDYPGQAEDAAAIARAMIGTPYSFASYSALAAWRWGLSTPKLEAWINRRKSERAQVLSHNPGAISGVDHVDLPCEAICSVLADQAWSLAGKKIFQDGRPHQTVTPGALAERLLWMDGVVRFGYGIL